MESNSSNTSVGEGDRSTPQRTRRHSANERVTRNGVTKLPRGRSGCLNCRRRRKKCDEKKPICTKCQGYGENCEWDTGITFRASGFEARQPVTQRPHRRSLNDSDSITIIDVKFDAGNRSSSRRTTSTEKRPQTQQSERATSRGSQNKIDETEKLDRRLAAQGDLFLDSPSALGDEDITSLLQTAASSTTEHDVRSRPDHGTEKHWLLTEQYALGSNLDNFAAQQLDINSSLAHSSTDYSALDGPPVSTHLASVNPSDNIEIWDQTKARGDTAAPGFSTSGLEVLDYLTWHSAPTIEYPALAEEDPATSWSLLDWRHIMPTTPSVDQFLVEPSPEFDCGYYPNAAYKELHTTLHSHLVATAMHTGLTRHATPERQAHEMDTIESRLDESGSTLGQLGQSNEKMSHPLSRKFSSQSMRSLEQSNDDLGDASIPPQRRLELIQNYLQEVARWLDMFDSERHFQLKIPLMAKTADHLQYSILALSARQMERRDPDKPYTESLGLYQKAIKLIVPKLQSLEPEVIASCVLLCVLEMMSSSPRAWSRHLDGCAMLLQAAGINGVVGGVRQALFWCFARMDVWGGFLGHTLTKIPTNRWFTTEESMSTVIKRFRAAAGNSESHANYAAFLCASVVNVISDRHNTTYGQNSGTPDTMVSYATRWKALYDLLEDWHTERPEEMQPLFTHNTSSDTSDQPFPIILYPNPPAISGNQLYHAAAILLLQEQPRELKVGRSKKSVLWHARQICGISLSNNEHGPWVNALQPLWIAGKLMSHRTEHEAILNVLTRIEKETGWATAWRAQDLIDHWGDI